MAKKEWKKNIEQKNTFELRGGNPSKFPANILSTVSSSRGIAFSGKNELFLSNSVCFALQGLLPVAG